MIDHEKSPIESATHLEIDAGVRYWDDATVNGVVDTEGILIPLRQGDGWCPVIRLADGLVEGWPAGTTARLCYKVCDAGFYWLRDADGKRLAKWGSSYVPTTLLDRMDWGPGGTDGGDYINLSIGPDGLIEGWPEPRLVAERWKSVEA